MRIYRHIRFWTWLVGILLLTLEPAHTFLHGNEASPRPHSSTQWHDTAEIAAETGLSPEECLLCNGLLSLCACPTPHFPEPELATPARIALYSIYYPGISHTLSDARAPPVHS
ncbi:MAG: hypothetical protein II943_01225 [Victivallales bacterium]|nr:hypothetical protein [Victivallales bacterium]